MESKVSLEVQNLGKKFYHRWIFKDLSFKLAPSEQVAVVGSNGSGKSTLLHLLAGQALPTQGKVAFQSEGKVLPRENWYRYLSWASPAMEIYTELSLKEHLRLHFSFNKCILENPQDIVEVLKLEGHAHKPLRFFSSGMLQKVKIGQAIFTHSSILLLDEPTSFMDEANSALTLDLIQKFANDRTLVIATNIEREHKLFKRHISL
ncbi:MAG: ATP-binding cassette domain-containing protein [Bacteroidota bacterium]